MIVHTILETVSSITEKKHLHFGFYLLKKKMFIVKKAYSCIFQKKESFRANGIAIKR